MKPMEAWENIKSRLDKLLSVDRGYESDDVQAEVMCYMALKKMEEQQNENKS